VRGDATTLIHADALLRRSSANFLVMFRHDGARSIKVEAHRLVLDRKRARHERTRAPLVEIERGDGLLILFLLRDA